MSISSCWHETLLLAWTNWRGFTSHTLRAGQGLKIFNRCAQVRLSCNARRGTNSKSTLIAMKSVIRIEGRVFNQLGLESCQRPLAVFPESYLAFASQNAHREPLILSKAQLPSCRRDPHVALSDFLSEHGSGIGMRIVARPSFLFPTRLPPGFAGRGSPPSATLIDACLIASPRADSVFADAFCMHRANIVSRCRFRL